MKKLIVIAALFLFLSFFKSWGGASFAQNRTIDSLHTLIKTDKPDTNKVRHLNALS